MWLALFLKSAFFSPKKNALWGAMFTFALAVMPLTLVYTLSLSMIDSIYERSVETLYYHAQLCLSKSASFSEIQKLRQLPYVENIWKEKQSFAVILNESGQREALLLRGLQPSLLDSVNFWKYLFNEHNQTLKEPLNLQKGEIALAKSLAQLLHVHEGQTLNLLTSGKIGSRRIPKITPLKIKLIFSTGYQELDSLWGLVNLEEEDELFGSDSSVIWGVKFKGLKLNEIENFTQKLNQASPDNKVNWLAWTHFNESQRENFQSLQTFFYVLFSLIILMASFNLSSAIVIYIIEQAHEIAILKTIGLSTLALKALFALLACLISFFGCVVGVINSLILSTSFKELLSLAVQVRYYLIKTIVPLLMTAYSTDIPHELPTKNYYLSQISLQLPFSFIAILLAFCLFLSAMASLWATRKLIYFKPKLLLN